jgi:CBS domain containing-hemolysin-like protein
MDNIVGIVAVKDVLMAVAKGWLGEDEPVDKIMRPAYFAPETKRINGLFKEMRDKNYRMCVVVDEYGGTAGVVTLTQLVEEIVGPVGDELRVAEKDYEVLSDNTFQIDAGMRIEDANKEMRLSLPESDEYDTVAGFILFLLGRLPRQNEQISYKGLKLAVTEMRGSKLERILVTREPRPVGASAEDATVH